MNYLSLKEFIYNHFKDTTASGYWASIKVFTDKHINQNINEFDSINNIELIEEHLDNYFTHKNISTKQKFISSLFTVLRKLHNENIYYSNPQLLDNIKLKFYDSSQICKNNEINKIVENKYTLSDIFNILTNTTEFTQEYIYLASLLYIPIRRLDWEYAVFVKQEDHIIPTDVFNHHFNYVIINTDNTISLDFYNFKTVKFLGPYRKTLVNTNYSYLDKIKKYTYINPEKFSSLLFNYYNQNITRKFILTNNSNGFTKGTFSNWVRRGPLKSLNISHTDIRYILISTVMNKVGLYMTTAEKLEFANDMGQKNLTTQDTYREVPDLPESDETVEPTSDADEDKYINYFQNEIQKLQSIIREHLKNIESFQNIKNIKKNIKL